MSYYSYNYILEYIPSKYCGLSNKQQADRQAVYDFERADAEQDSRNHRLESKRMGCLFHSCFNKGKADEEIRDSFHLPEQSACMSRLYRRH